MGLAAPVSHSCTYKRWLQNGHRSLELHRNLLLQFQGESLNAAYMNVHIAWPSHRLSAAHQSYSHEFGASVGANSYGEGANETLGEPW